MDDDIQTYADALQETYRVEARQKAQEKPLELVRHLSDVTIGVSGSQVKALVKTHVETIELYMEARLRSYQEAYAETGRSPSETELHIIMTECKAVRMAEVARATSAMVRNMHSSATGSPFSEESLRKMIEGGSDHGHDRVLAKWKVWRAKTLLKPAPTEFKAREKRRDGLTQTCNQEQFLLDLPVFTAGSSEARPTSLLVLDLDGFKPLNDTLGHLAGNRALKECADVLLRTSDGKGEVYRNGGDEFCVLLPNHANDEAQAVADRILRKMREIKTEELPSGLSVSVGIVSCAEADMDPEKLFSRADAAMYVSKNAGGNQVSVAE